MTSILVFDITQFFPLLNYQLLLVIFNKAGFDFKVTLFYLQLPSKKKNSIFLEQFLFFLF